MTSTFFHRPRAQNRYASSNSPFCNYALLPIGQFHFRDAETVNLARRHEYQSVHLDVPRSSQNIRYASLVGLSPTVNPSWVRLA